MAGSFGRLGRALAQESVLATANAVFCGIILANVAIAADRQLLEYAQMSLSPTWSYVAALLCGFSLAAILDGVKWLLYAIGLSALVATLILSTVLLSGAPEILTYGIDLVFLYAFQQSFPRFIVFCVLGGIGGIIAVEVKRILSQR